MVVGASMNCPYCGAELRDGVRYCTACGAAVNGISADSGLRVKPRNHVAVILVCMLVIGIVGGSCMGLHLRQVLSHFVSAHSEHAIVLDVTAAGWDTDNGASRVPIHITGKTIDGITVDRIEFVASDGSGINLIQGVYTLEAAGSPIARMARSIKFHARVPHSSSMMPLPWVKRSIWPSLQNRIRFSPSAPLMPPM